MFVFACFYVRTFECEKCRESRGSPESGVWKLRRAGCLAADVRVRWETLYTIPIMMMMMRREEEFLIFSLFNGERWPIFGILKKRTFLECKRRRYFGFGAGVPVSVNFKNLSIYCI